MSHIVFLLPRTCTGTAELILPADLSITLIRKKSLNLLYSKFMYISILSGLGKVKIFPRPLSIALRKKTLITNFF